MRLLRINYIYQKRGASTELYLDPQHCAQAFFEEFLGDTPKPEYAIASHRWTNDELTYADIVNHTGTGKKGWQKLQRFCAAVHNLQRSPPIEYLWIDTCCINKTNSTELSEALNSMYRWYSEATICLAWLHDVPSLTEMDPDDLAYAFTSSEWFKRGWTLQELLAPKRVIFYTVLWEPIGFKASIQKTKLGCPVSAVGLPINNLVSKATGIPEFVLLDTSQAENLSFEERQSWMKGRKTTRVEDMAYCQLGLFGVFLSPIYGEREEAYERLLEAVERKRQRLKQKAQQGPISSSSPQALKPTQEDFQTVPVFGRGHIQSGQKTSTQFQRPPDPKPSSPATKFIPPPSAKLSPSGTQFIRPADSNPLFAALNHKPAQ